MRRIAEGLQIIVAYEGGAMGDGSVSFEHDEIFAGSTRPGKMWERDVVRLLELGWVWEDDGEYWHHF
jgi:hypothetical protein